MTIYIESFLIENALINFCLMRLIYLTLKPKTKTYKIVLASVLGAILSAISLVVESVVVANLLKFACRIFMLVVAFKQRKKQFVFGYLLFYLFGVALIGTMAMLTSKIDATYNLEAFTFVAILVSYLLEFVVKKIKFKIKTSNLIYPVTLVLNKREIKINAFLDTGNLLSYNRQPVVVVDLKTYLDLTKTNIVNFYLKKEKQISLNTVSGNNFVKIFKLDYLQIEVDGKTKTIENQYIAVNNSNCFKHTNYQALITPQMI